MKWAPQAQPARGEANLLSCSSVMIVEYMRQGTRLRKAA